jgi:hypothetical protein
MIQAISEWQKQSSIQFGREMEVKLSLARKLNDKMIYVKLP